MGVEVSALRLGASAPEDSTTSHQTTQGIWRTFLLVAKYGSHAILWGLQGANLVYTFGHRRFECINC